VKVGLILPMFSGDPERVLGFAIRAEELGYDGVFAFDHFFPPGAAPDRPALEAFATLAAVGAATERVRVGTLVTRAQLRPAGLLAKMVANVDEITGGRVILGLGTGDPLDDPEHHAFGFPTLSRIERRRHLEETLLALKALYAGGSWRGGDHVPAMSGPILPPVRSGGPPIWVGAQADEVVRLAGRLSDGWNGWGFGAEAFARKVAVLEAAAAESGREVVATWAGIVLAGDDPAHAERLRAARRDRGMADDGIWAGGLSELGAFLASLQEAGAAWAIMVPAGPPDRPEAIARSVLPGLRGRVEPK
jgi:alkanesulfonate monooxygenase SsuD/methylene tetrahydromethanopterin reductase-like flavin-dependent oxidoreductase (luciferase family)